MQLFNFSEKKDEDKFSISVEIYQSVLDRIEVGLLTSDIEEGGKFLGAIFEDKMNINVKVYSYIDAGPRVSNSQTHIMPDGEHQEHLFRIIEGYDSSIEHIGSWHSHHCNGYPDLSSGDIEGYEHIVNHKSYNLNWFFVMLVTGIKERSIEAKYYLFHRGDKKIYCINSSKISFLNREYRYESILVEVEKSTYGYRYQKHQSNNFSVSDRNTMRKWETLMRNIRADDKIWIEKKFDSPRAVRNNKTNSIYWRFNAPFNRENLEITYTYPGSPGKSQSAILIIFYREKEVVRSDINLDDDRFQHIISQIEKAQKILVYL
jgi:hypothetical protein